MSQHNLIFYLNTDTCLHTHGVGAGVRWAEGGGERECEIEGAGALILRACWEVALMLVQKVSSS